MRTRLPPRVGACLFIGLVLLAGGCATSPGGTYSPSRGPAIIGHRATVLIETTNVVGPSGEIFVNGQSWGFTPVRLTIETDPVGNALEDTEIIARWDDGRNESFFKLTQGTRPDPVIRFSPGSSMRDY